MRCGVVGTGRVMLRFRIDGCSDLVIPPPAGDGRADELWKTTCCELFLAGPGGRYREFNFSPSGRWAAWEFTGYRTARVDVDPVVRPMVSIDSGRKVFTLTVFLDKAEFLRATRIALTAVLEEKRGRMSYWAARHGGLKPDFHEPSCFVLPVP